MSLELQVILSTFFCFHFAALWKIENLKVRVRRLETHLREEGET